MQTQENHTRPGDSRRLTRGTGGLASLGLLAAMLAAPMLLSGCDTMVQVLQPDVESIEAIEKAKPKENDDDY